MIYLITGVPGSGKTLYAVSTLVQKLAAEKIKGSEEKSRRVVVDGIPDLLLPHELMAPMVEDDKGNLTCEGDGLLTWFDWCRPGDVIVVDEVQRYWRPRGMGTKPPEMIKQLETHRHKGVDFVIVTQNPMLIDQNVRRLVGRHQHVRRLFGMARAIIYDWDGCSVDVHRTKSATASLWSYPKSAYKLYKSSELHTKQKQKIPAWLIVPVLALVGGIAIAPKAFSTMQGAMTGKGVASAASVASPSVVSSVDEKRDDKPTAASPAVAGAPANTAEVPQVEFAGCVVFRSGCTCHDQNGKRVKVELQACEAQTDFGPIKDGQIDRLAETTIAALEQPRPVVASEADLDTLAFMARNRR